VLFASGALLLGITVSAAPPVAGAGPAPLARVDAAWPERDAAGRIDEVRAALEAAERAAPDDFEVLWRLARYFVWVSDDGRLPAKERSRLGRRAWEYGERAAAAAPSRVEGHLYTALGIGNYALGIGVLSALRQGIEGKFKASLSRAEEIDPGYLDATIPTAWGRFWYELPWPKYSARRSEESLRRALRLNAANLRARVYLAELYLKEGRVEPARELLREAVGARAGAYDAAEERRMQARAREILSNLDAGPSGGDDDRAAGAGEERAGG
jgi:hypothetical protein